jgi:hypothetical protein
MSHYVLLTIGVSPNQLDEALAPFYEQTEDQTFLEFRETESEYREQYETKSVEMVRLADGTLKYRWDEDFKQGVFPKEETVFPEGSTLVQVQFKERFVSFEEFMLEWHGSEARDPEKGVYGYYRNPKAKWDWYVVGGRWTGYFKLKPGAKGELGQSGVFDNKPKPGSVDVIRKGDWDLDYERNQAGEHAKARYEKFFAMLAASGHTLPRTWADVREEHSDDADTARAAYKAQPVVDFIEKSEDGGEWLGFNGDPGAEFGCDLETYVARAKESVGVPVAILKDGVWRENETMGWFGAVGDEKANEAWMSEFAKMIDSLPDDTLLMAVDCHI